MNPAPPTCDRSLFELFLEGELYGPSESDLVTHLDHCPSCQESLATQAADADYWNEARDLLVSSDQESSSHLDMQNIVAMLLPTDDPQMLGRLGTYEVSGVIGKGGMGIVLKAHDGTLDRTVAINVMAPHLASSSSARARFARESRATAAVLHPNVIAIHSVSEGPSLPYIVMPYVPGTSLQRRVEMEGPLPLRETLRIAQQIAAGLAAAHAQGLVHRDIKPANILLENDVERVTITDFGLARAVDDASMTRSGVIAGTPQYMSPEQARGESIDQRSDLFSLGSVLYFMCAGRPPFRADSTFGVLRKISDVQPQSISEVNPDVPAWLCSLAEQLMAKQVEKRHGSAQVLADQLESCIAHVQDPSIVPLPKTLVPKRKERSFNNPIRKGLIGMTIFIGLIALAVVAGGTPSNIEGKWKSDAWGTVSITNAEPEKYEGAFEVGDVSGKLDLVWSRLERRYNGTWDLGGKARGRVSLRLVNGELKGAMRANRVAQKEQGIAALSDFAWARVTTADKAKVSDDNFAGDASSVKELEFRKRFDVSSGGHNLAIAYSPDGKFVATADRNPTRIMQSGGKSRHKNGWRPTVKIFDVEQQLELQSLQLVTEDELKVLDGTTSAFEVNAIAFSPDGETLAVGTSIGQFKLFNAHTGDLLRAFDDASKLDDKQTPANWAALKRAIGSVTALSFSPDGSQLAVCGPSFVDFGEHFDGIERLGFRATGPGRLKLWDVKTGDLQHDLEGHNNHVNAIAYSPDGRRLASAGRWHKNGDFGNGVIIWNPKFGTQIHRLIRVNANGGVRSVAFAPDGKMLAIGSQRFGEGGASPSTGGVSFVEVATGTERWLTTVPNWAYPIRFSLDGECVVVRCGKKSIRFLIAETGMLEHEITPTMQDSNWQDFAFSRRDGAMLIADVAKGRKGSVEIWKSKNRSLNATVLTTPNPSTDAGDSTLAAAEKEQRDLTRQFITRNEFDMLTCSNSGQLVAVAEHSSNEVDVYATTTGKHMSTIVLPAGTTAGVSSVALSVEGSQIAVGTGGSQVLVYNSRTGKMMQALAHQASEQPPAQVLDREDRDGGTLEGVAAVAFSPDGKLLATGGRSKLLIWDLSEGKVLHRLVGHEEVLDVEFSPDGMQLASCGTWKNGGGVMLWQTQAGKPEARIAVAGSLATRSVAYASDGKLIVFKSEKPLEKGGNGSTKPTISVAYRETGAISWQRDGLGLGTCQFFDGGDGVAAIHCGTSLTVYDAATGQTLSAIRPQLCKNGGRMRNYVVVNDGRLHVVGGVDRDGKGTVEVFGSL